MRSSFLQSPQVLCLEASAGSGKTYALARRYVQLTLYLALKGGPAIQPILAITFTNKATLGMKSRILDLLKRIALKKLRPFEIQDIIQPVGIDENKASSLALSVMSDVIRQYHYFQVQTIDSFVNILLVGCSFKVGLSARFKIKRNSRDYLELALDKLLDEALHNKQIMALFTDFVRQYLFLENRSGWFPRKDLLEVVVELFKQYNMYQKALLVYPVDEDPFAMKRRIFLLMQELKDHCPLETNKKFLEHLDGMLSRESNVFDVDDLKSYWSRPQFPVNKGGTITPELEGLWLELVKDIHSLCYLEARSIFNPYVILFEKVFDVFGDLARREDVLFLEELNRKAALLFEDGLISVEEIYFRLAARFQHYLMDEFQDTSLSQWRNLALMIEENLANGGSLFYVGDKKQAIYAFRGGESKLFDALQLQLAHFNLQKISLDKNYRSCPEIINFNNRVFSVDNLRAFLQRRLQDSQENKRDDIHFSESDFEPIKEVFLTANQSPGTNLTGGLVRVSFLDAKVKEERFAQARERLTALIGDLRQRFALKEIAILTRGNRELEEITQWLLEEGVAACSERSSDVKNNPLINELVSFLMFLYSPVNNNAFAEFCLGQLMPKATGISTEALRDFLFTYAQKSRSQKKGLVPEETSECLYQYFRDCFPQVWEDYFEDFFEQVGVYPLYELTASIIQRFGCQDHFPQYQGFLMHLLELIKIREKEGCDLASFLDYYEKLDGEERFVPMAQVEAVKILTVHKAKGLEFPVVILPFFEMDVKATNSGPNTSQAFVLDIAQEGISLIRQKDTYRKFCPELQERYEQEYKKSFLVELNNAYVALTRAIEELYVFVPLRAGIAVNPARFLIPEDCLSMGTPDKRAVSHEMGPVHQKIKPLILAPWRALYEETLNRPAQSVKKARLGEFYHALLMRIRHMNDKNIDQLIKKAFDETSSLFMNVSDLNILTDLRSFITRVDVCPFFYLPKGVQVYCEKEFVNIYGDSKRIDRLIVLDNEVWIVDFKLSEAADEAHQKQINEYVDLIKPLYPRHKVSGHVLYLT
ncbi:MAG: UvrD-helicase domain-containing protein [Candidatus Omnitrophica bacterium]|nr:UvrD-helicase domain-containing protein [Candidatus Omnitrophota bacterium]